MAALSAVLAAALIYLFVSHYKKNTAAPVVVTPPATVWIATHPILKGTPEASVASLGYFKPTQVPASQVMPGAITDPAQIVGQVVQNTIAARQQITVSEFAKGPVLAADLKGIDRGVAFTLDNEHGLTTWLAVGDTVDVMLVNPKSGTSKLIEQNVTVLANSQGLVVLRLSDKQALLATSGSTKGELWLSLRPAIKAKNSIRIYSIGSV